MGSQAGFRSERIIATSYLLSVLQPPFFLSEPSDLTHRVPHNSNVLDRVNLAHVRLEASLEPHLGKLCTRAAVVIRP